MAVDKLVDSAQLDSDLEDIADAIRAKSGGSSPLAFPSGFISEIGNIPSGGGSGYAKKTGSFVLAENYTYSGRLDQAYSGSILIATGLSKIEAIIIWSEEWAAETETNNCFGLSRAFTNKPVTATGVIDACHYYSGSSLMRNGTNNLAFTTAQGFFFHSIDSNIPEGSFGLRCHSANFPIIAGHTIKWEAWGTE